MYAQGASPSQMLAHPDTFRGSNSLSPQRHSPWPEEATFRAYDGPPTTIERVPYSGQNVPTLANGQRAEFDMNPPPQPMNQSFQNPYGTAPNATGSRHQLMANQMQQLQRYNQPYGQTFGRGQPYGMGGGFGGGGGGGFGGGGQQVPFHEHGSNMAPPTSGWGGGGGGWAQQSPQTGAYGGYGQGLSGGGLVGAAQGIASLGRYGDSMLVHMNPEEVSTMHQLGGLTVNPETGLPEAFSFGGLLKGIAPLALGLLGGPFSSPWLAAALSGAVSGIKDKSIKSGMLAGLTSYGLSKGLDAFKSGAQSVIEPVEMHSAPGTQGIIDDLMDSGGTDWGHKWNQTKAGLDSLRDAATSRGGIQLVAQVGNLANHVEREKQARDMANREDPYDEAVRRAYERYFGRFEGDRGRLTGFGQYRGFSGGGLVAPLYARRRGYSNGGPIDDEDAWMAEWEASQTPDGQMIDPLGKGRVYDPIIGQWVYPDGRGDPNDPYWAGSESSETTTTTTTTATDPTLTMTPEEALAYKEQLQAAHDAGGLPIVDGPWWNNPDWWMENYGTNGSFQDPTGSWIDPDLALQNGFGFDGVVWTDPETGMTLDTSSPDATWTQPGAAVASDMQVTNMHDEQVWMPAGSYQDDVGNWYGTDADGNQWVNGYDQTGTIAYAPAVTDAVDETPDLDDQIEQALNDTIDVGDMYEGVTGVDLDDLDLTNPDYIDTATGTGSGGYVTGNETSVFDTGTEWQPPPPPVTENPGHTTDEEWDQQSNMDPWGPAGPNDTTGNPNNEPGTTDPGTTPQNPPPPNDDLFDWDLGDQRVAPEGFQHGLQGEFNFFSNLIDQPLAEQYESPLDWPGAQLGPATSQQTMSEEEIAALAAAFGAQPQSPISGMDWSYQPPDPNEGMSDGGLVRGDGTGLSDSVPALSQSGDIMLSDGEFVVPADVVSMLGDGSTQAGARTLQSLIDRVRMMKTGDTMQAPPMGAAPMRR